VSEEQPLIGGMNPAAGLVRIGQTVRRPAGPSSVAVRSLLLHLADVGFEGAPRFLGIDDKGRDVLTFIDGDDPNANRILGRPLRRGVRCDDKQHLGRAQSLALGSSAHNTDACVPRQLLPPTAEGSPRLEVLSGVER